MNAKRVYFVDKIFDVKTVTISHEGVAFIHVGDPKDKNVIFIPIYDLIKVFLNCQSVGGYVVGSITDESSRQIAQSLRIGGENCDSTVSLIKCDFYLLFFF